MKKNDFCEEMRILVGEYARGESACLDPGERARVEAHLPGCADCRAHLASIRDISAALASVREIEVPEDVAERSRQRLDAMLKQKVAEMKAKTEAEAIESTRPLADEANDSKAAEDRPANVRRFPRWRIAAGIAASVLIAVGVSMWFCNDRNTNASISKTESVVANASSEPKRTAKTDENADSEMAASQTRSQTDLRAKTADASSEQADESSFENRLASAPTSRDAYKVVKASFEEAKARNRVDGADFEKTAGLCAKMAELWPGTWETVNVRKKQADCHVQMGDMDGYREAIVAYAEAWAAMPGEKESRCRKVILEEADTIYYNQKDYLQALALYDIIVTRYPDSPEANRAVLKTAKYYSTVREYAEAIRVLKPLTEKKLAPETRREAYFALADAYRGARDPDRAVAAFRELIAKAEDDATKARARVEIGMTLYSRGTTYYPDAISAFREIEAKHPNSPCKKTADVMLAQLQEKVSKWIEDDIKF